MYARVLLVLFIVLPILAEAQSPAINRFYRQHKKEKGMLNATLPGWLVKLGAGVIRPFVDDEEGKIALRMGYKVKKAKFMLAEEATQITPGQYLQLIAEVKDDGYETLMQVREEGEIVTLLSREKKGYIGNLLFLVRGEDSFVMLSLKTKLKMEDISNMINDMLALEKEKKAKKETTEQLST